MTLEGLHIRRAEPEDYSAIYEMFSSPSVFPNTLRLPYPSREYWRRRLTDLPESRYNLVAVVNDCTVGLVSLDTFPNRPRRRHAGAIGLCVDGEWQGKGVGSALVRTVVDFADNWVNLLRLELEVFADNERAIRLYERFGFEVEGTLRQYAFRDGQYVDKKLMARLRP